MSGKQSMIWRGHSKVTPSRKYQHGSAYIQYQIAYKPQPTNLYTQSMHTYTYTSHNHNVIPAPDVYVCERQQHIDILVR